MASIFLTFAPSRANLNSEVNNGQHLNKTRTLGSSPIMTVKGCPFLLLFCTRSYHRLSIHKAGRMTWHLDTHTIQSEKTSKSFKAVDFLYASCSTSLKTCFLWLGVNESWTSTVGPWLWILCIWCSYHCLDKVESLILLRWPRNRSLVTNTVVSFSARASFPEKQRRDRCWSATVPNKQNRSSSSPFLTM